MLGVVSEPSLWTQDVSNGALDPLCACVAYRSKSAGTQSLSDRRTRRSAELQLSNLKLARLKIVATIAFAIKPCGSHTKKLSGEQTFAAIQSPVHALQKAYIYSSLAARASSSGLRRARLGTANTYYASLLQSLFIHLPLLRAPRPRPQRGPRGNELVCKCAVCIQRPSKYLISDGSLPAAGLITGCVTCPRPFVLYVPLKLMQR